MLLTLLAAAVEAAVQAADVKAAVQADVTVGTK